MSGESILSYEESNEDAASYTKSICLQEGEYEFIIYDSFGSGLSYGGGQYNITAMNGEIIAQGGEFQYSETTQFFLPFVPSPSALPSMSPSMLMLPTLSPYKHKPYHRFSYSVLNMKRNQTDGDEIIFSRKP